MLKRNILITLFLIVITLYLSTIKVDTCSYYTICVITVADILFLFYMLWCHTRISVTNPILWFWSINVIFSLGQNLAYLFIADQELIRTDLLYGLYYSSKDMCKGTIYTLQCLNLFTLGLIGEKYQSINLNNQCKDLLLIENEEPYLKATYYLGTGLLIVSIVPQIIYLFTEVKIYFTQGYGYTSADQLSGLTLRLHYLFMPALIMRICSMHFLNKKSVFETIIILFQVCIFLIIGDRGLGLSLLSTYIWIKAVTDKEFHIRKYIVPVAFLILAIPIIKYYRIAYTENASSPLTSAIIYAMRNNPIIDILLEMGGSQRILIMTMKKTEVTGLAYGRAYLDFFIKMIPGVLGIKQNYGTLAKWVINTTGYQTKGFSIWAEAYLNFGYAGIMFMYVLGCMFRYLFSFQGKLYCMDLIKIAISLSFFADIARRSVAEYGYIFAYDLIMPLLLIRIIANFLKYRRTHYG